MRSWLIRIALLYLVIAFAPAAMMFLMLQHHVDGTHAAFEECRGKLETQLRSAKHKRTQTALTKVTK